MKDLFKIAGVTTLLMLAPVIAMADVDCAEIFEQALESTKAACSEVERNELCYGYGDFTAQVQAGYEGTAFYQPGDVVDVTGIQQLSLHTNANTGWNLAVMKIQADLPDDSPEQNLIVLLMGNLEIENRSNMPAGTTIEDDLNPLRPMSAMHFSSGVGSGSCDETLPDGLLIQAPESTESAKATLMLNGVKISLNSTIWALSGNLDDDWQPEIAVTVLEQDAEIAVDDVFQSVLKNQTMRVPEEHTGWAWGAPVVVAVEADGNGGQGAMIDRLGDTLNALGLRGMQTPY